MIQMAKKIVTPPNKRLLHWTDEERNRYFPYLFSLYLSEEVKAGGAIYPLSSEKSLGTIQGARLLPSPLEKKWLTDYQRDFNLAGLLVLIKGKIGYEWYKAGVREETLWPSFSIVKSITSLLVGVAHKEGAIKTLDDHLINYLPELKHSPYEFVTVRHLLTMQTGVPWLEDTRNPHSTIATKYRLEGKNYKEEVIRYIQTLPPSSRQKKVWNYNTSETDLLGLVLQEAMGMSMANILSQYIWQPFAMERSAFWAVDQIKRYNLGGSGLSATLRDYGRLGQFVLQDCSINGTPIVSEEWRFKSRQNMVTLEDNPHDYGYLWWIDKRETKTVKDYMALGMYGQSIYLNPTNQMVIVQLGSFHDTRSPSYVKAYKAMIQYFEESGIT